MTLWTQLIIEMIWHVMIIGSGILFLAIIAYYFFKQTYIYPKPQKISYFVANFFAVVSVLIFLTALISAVLESLLYLMALSLSLTVISFYFAIASERLR